MANILSVKGGGFLLPFSGRIRRVVVDAIKEGVKEKEQNATQQIVQRRLIAGSVSDQLQNFERLHWVEPI